MRRPFVLVVAAAAIAGLTNSLPAAPPTAAELAVHLDSVRRPTKSFEVTIKLTEIRDGKVDKAAQYEVSARKVAGYPDFDTVTRCLLPDSDKGKVLLTRGNEAWLYDPKSSRPVSISYEKVRSSKFFFAYGLTSSFAQEYDAMWVGVETILDAARKDRSCHHLHFVHREGSKLAPGSLDYWVDVDSRRPVRGHILSASGKLLRTVYYTRFQEVLGRERPTRLLVVSGSERGLVIDVDFSQFAYKELPADMFTQENLPVLSRQVKP